MTQVDIGRLAGTVLPETRTTWDVDDVILYQLAVGAGNPPTDVRELAYAYENGLQVLPSFGAVPAVSHLMRLMPTAEIGLDLTAVLHGEQEVELSAPLPPTFDGTTRIRIGDVYDKGRGALVVFETVTTDGELVVRGTSRFFVRGAGGFGGDPGQPTVVDQPLSAPTYEATIQTLPQQALLYRLTGDKNPLHADPVFARASGFDRPILHGMCTFGAVCKAAITLALDGDSARVRSYRARFGGVVYPGESLRVRLWRDHERLQLEVAVVERDTPALTNAVIELV